jgi:cell division protein FtsZ
VGKITDYLQNKAGFEADVIWGNGRDDSLGEEISVTLIATGFGSDLLDEIGHEKKLKKETHKLNQGSPDQKDREPVRASHAKGAKDKSQKTLDFSGDGEDRGIDPDFEVLYPKTAKERKSQVENTRMDYSTATDEDLEEMENIPAYKRRQLRMNDPKYKQDLSKYSVTKENKLSDKNSYLHGQVD